MNTIPVISSCIIGVGNELRRDDGIGLEVLRCLEIAGMDQTYDLIPLGQDILELASIIERYRQIFIIDALEPGEQPGKITIYGWTDRFKSVRESLSLHDLDVFFQIQLAEARGITAEVELMGVVTSDLGFGIGLSPELQIRLDGIVDEIKAYFNRKALR